MRTAAMAVFGALLGLTGCAGDGASGDDFPNLGTFPPKPTVRTAEGHQQLQDQLAADRAQAQALAAARSRPSDAQLE